MMWWPGEHMTGWGWAAMTISMILFWGLLILGGCRQTRHHDEENDAAGVEIHVLAR